MKTILFLCCIIFHLSLSAQCTITSRIGANGTTNKTTNSEVFYFTERYTIYSSVLYDGIDYYFVLMVKPVSGKKEVEKVLTLQLSNEETIDLDFYDSYTTEKDTSLSILFKIKKEHLQLLSTNDVTGIKLTVESEDKNFKLIRHKDQLRQQIDCLMKDKKKEKDKEKEDEKKE